MKTQEPLSSHFIRGLISDLDGVAYYLVEDASDPESVLLLRESGSGLETVDGDDFKRVMAALEEDRVE